MKKSIRYSYQIVLVLIAVNVVLLTGEWSAGRALNAQTNSIHSAIDIYTLSLRADAAKFSALPYAATLQPDVISALTKDDLVIRQRVNRYLEDINQRVGSDAFYVMDLKGITIASSNWDSPKSFVGKNYANRPYFTDSLKGKTGLFYGIGQTTSIPGLFIATPAYQNGIAIGVVVIKVSLRDMEAAWEKLPAPVMVSDAIGIFFLGSTSDWKYQTKRTLEEEDLKWVLHHKQYGDRQSFAPVPWSIEPLKVDSGYLIQTQLKGKPQRYLAFDQTLPELGWTLTVMGDYRPVVLARITALVLGTLGTALLAFGILYWRLREKRLTEQSNARKELEVRVKERTHELHGALAFQQAMENSLLVGMRARDLDGRIIYVNAAFCDMTGFSASTLIGCLPPYPYWHQNDLNRHWCDSKTVLSGNASVEGFESRIKHNDGHDVYTMVYTAPLIDATGKKKGWMSSVVDITEQKKAESKQRLLDAQLHHTARLASMGEMASTLAHELNQPLMALSNYASAARVFATQGNQTLLINSLQEITLQSQRSADIVRRIRGFVKPVTTGVEFCHLNNIVNNVLALLASEMKRNQTTVTCRLSEPLPALSGDRLLLEQVVLNILMNSVQAMQHKPREQRLIDVETLQADQSVCIRISDFGTGINSSIESKIFDPFFTTKVDGLGLGLNICRTIIESHHGELRFENRTDDNSQGAIFSIKLPL
jgi:two-component system, LuxR family, sensor histidine kinase DctS